jgi:uncharacterized C2H2 Zn-finger protein
MAQAVLGRPQNAARRERKRSGLCNRLLPMDVLVSVPILEDPVRKAYSCAVCDKSFKRKADCIRHGRIHTGEKPYRCDGCGEAYARQDALRRHQTKGSAKCVAAGQNLSKSNPSSPTASNVNLSNVSTNFLDQNEISNPQFDQLPSPIILPSSPLQNHISTSFPFSP